MGSNTLQRNTCDWSIRASKEKYVSFEPAINAATEKVDEYYIKSADSTVHIMTMALHLTCKLSHFKKHWDAHLQDEVVELILKKFEERYRALHANDAQMSEPPCKKRKTAGTLLRVSDTDSDDSDDEEDTPNDPTKPWMTEFRRYLDTNDLVLEGMPVVEWWGIHAHRYPTWASLVHDYLAIMASSVSSERAFSSAGITISKRRNRLKGDIVEALQCLKCMYHNHLIFREVATCADEEINLDDIDEEKDIVVNDELSFSWDHIIVDDIEDSDCEDI
ncbi:hypothetical protein DXG01_002077 [Tephrocybe rancida]|nr:hypothetical protein DXG01_002077 [Tephrocybe rancida]